MHFIFDVVKTNGGGEYDEFTAPESRCVRVYVDYLHGELWTNQISYLRES